MVELVVLHTDGKVGVVGGAAFAWTLQLDEITLPLPCKCLIDFEFRKLDLHCRLIAFQERFLHDFCHAVVLLNFRVFEVVIFLDFCDNLLLHFEYLIELFASDGDIEFVIVLLDPRLQRLQADELG